MSLNFSFAKVRDHEQVTTSPFDPEKWHPVADALVWLSMICGYSSITKKNWRSVAARIMAYQQGVGPYLNDGKGKKLYITHDDVERFIGMTTNANVLTDAAWHKKLAMHVYDESKYISQEKSALEHAAELAAAKETL